METSALDASNVDSAFETILEQCYRVVKAKQPEKSATGSPHGEANGQPAAGTKISIEAPKTSKKTKCC